MTCLDAALSYAKRGWQVFPCHSVTDGCCTCGKPGCERAGKHPRTPHGLNDATTDSARIKAWWSQWPDANVAIRTGKASGLCVIDMDGPEACEALSEYDALPSTPTVKTRKGFHYYLAHPGCAVKTGVRILPDVDSRGDGGYVLAPPSRHAGGGLYEWLVGPEEPPAPCPDWWLELLTPGKPPNPPPATAAPGSTAPSMLARQYVARAVERELAELRAAAPGSQNHTLNVVSFELGSLAAADWTGLSRAEVEAAIEAVALSWPCSSGPWTRENMRPTMESGLNAGARKPRPMPADWPARPFPFGNGKASTGKPVEKSSGASEEAEPMETATTSVHPEALSTNALARQWADLVSDSFAYLDGSQWWQYNQGRWRYAPDAYVYRAVREYLDPLHGKPVYVGASKYFSVTGTAIREVAFQAGTHLLASFNEFNANADLVPFRNGVYRISSGDLVPHDPAFRLITQLPFDYDATAECPTWLRFLDQVLIDADGCPCGEWIDLMQEWFGYCLVPSTAAEATMLWHGEGENGKGVASYVLESLVGDENRVSVAIEELNQPYFRASLHGKLLGLCNELDKRALAKNGEYFKAIVTGDPVTARQPGEKVFTFRPTLRIVMSTNNLPDTNDLSHGYFRRLLMVEWRYQVPKGQRDTALKSKLRRELPGIFNWALVGLKRFQDRGWRFADVGASEQVLEEYRYSQDPVRQFLDDECEMNPNGVCCSGDLYHAFRSWCQANGIRLDWSSQAFGRELTRRKIVDIGVRTIGNRKAKVRRGCTPRYPFSVHWPYGDGSDNRLTTD